MHTFLSTPVLASVDEYIPLVGVFIPIAVFIVGLLIVASVLYFKHQNRRLWHETARIALEKGQPIPNAPAEPEYPANKPEPRNAGRGDVRAGLILIAVSAGLYFGHFAVPFAIYIPGFIGAALLLNALITYLTTKKTPESTSTTQPPKA